MIHPECAAGLGGRELRGGALDTLGAPTAGAVGGSIATSRRCSATPGSGALARRTGIEGFSARTGFGSAGMPRSSGPLCSPTAAGVIRGSPDCGQGASAATICGEAGRDGGVDRAATARGVVSAAASDGGNLTFTVLTRIGLIGSLALSPAFAAAAETAVVAAAVGAGSSAGVRRARLACASAAVPAPVCTIREETDATE